MLRRSAVLVLCSLLFAVRYLPFAVCCLLSIGLGSRFLVLRASARDAPLQRDQLRPAARIDQLIADPRDHTADDRRLFPINFCHRELSSEKF